MNDENSGWVRFHRKALRSSTFSDPELWKLWSYLLLSAAFKPTQVVFRKQLISLLPGQLATSRIVLSQHTGLSERKIRTLTKILENDQQIDQVNFSRYTLVSITNWDDYQSNDQVIDKETTSRRPANDQQNKKGKNEKKDKKPPKSPTGDGGLGDELSVSIPEKLSSDEFKATWAEWTAYRSALKKVKNPQLMFSKQMKFLEAFPVATAIEIINASIRNGWQGLFEPKTNNGTVNGNRSAVSSPANGGIWHLKTRLDSKRERLKEIEDRAVHDAFGPSYNPEEKATVRQIKTEIKELRGLIEKG